MVDACRHYHHRLLLASVVEYISSHKTSYHHAAELHSPHVVVVVTLGVVVALVCSQEFQVALVVALVVSLVVEDQSAQVLLAFGVVVALVVSLVVEDQSAQVLAFGVVLALVVEDQSAQVLAFGVVLALVVSLVVEDQSAQVLLAFGVVV